MPLSVIGNSANNDDRLSDDMESSDPEWPRIRIQRYFLFSQSVKDVPSIDSEAKRTCACCPNTKEKRPFLWPTQFFQRDMLDAILHNKDWTYVSNVYYSFHYS